eukprot:3735630-Rhodomonas_salina.1
MLVSRRRLARLLVTVPLRAAASRSRDQTCTTQCLCNRLEPVRVSLDWSPPGPRSTTRAMMLVARSARQQPISLSLSQSCLRKAAAAT